MFCFLSNLGSESHTQNAGCCWTKDVGVAWNSKTVTKISLSFLSCICNYSTNSLVAVTLNIFCTVLGVSRCGKSPELITLTFFCWCHSLLSIFVDRLLLEHSYTFFVSWLCSCFWNMEAELNIFNKYFWIAKPTILTILRA